MIERHSFLSAIAVLFFVTSLLFGCSDSSTDSSQKTEGYRLIWEDNFDGNSLSTNNWSFQIGTGAEYGLNGWGNNELQYYTDRKKNVFVENGYLTIQAHKESINGQPYTSARIVTKDKHYWKYGKIEIRAKMPETQSIWPAIWMLPQENRFGNWPASGEIDIMELLGHQPDIVHGTVHYGNSFNDKGSSSGVVKSGESTFAEDFYVYSIEWDQRGIQWLLNGEPYHEVTPEDVNPFNWPFDEPFYLLLNVAVGGNWPGYPDSSTMLPQEMVVDYVRVYQKDE